MIIAGPRMRRTLRRMHLSRVLATIIIAAGAFVILIPLAYMISASLQSNTQIQSFPTSWIPKPIVWRNYWDGLTSLPFAEFFKNSFVILILQTAGGLGSSLLAGFGFAVLRAPEKRWLFIVLLASIMLPSQVTMVPNYLIFRWLGWIDTFAPLIVPAWFGVPFFIFLIRQFFFAIPYELFEAARADGASYFRIFLQIYLPLSKPVIAAVILFSIMNEWNEFLEPLIYLNSIGNFTVTLGLRLFAQTSTTVGNPNWMMAVALVAMIVPVAAFFILQRQFIRGIVTTGLSGR